MLSFSIVKAQAPTSIDGIDISMSPENPSPRDLITVSITSYLTDLNSASVVWTVDGKLFSKGTGLKSIQIPAPSLGKTKLVSVGIQTVEGRSVQKSLVVRSGDVDMIWENNGYLPPLFKGKVGLVYQNTARIIAIPHLSSGGATEINPSQLVYKWKVGEKVLLEQSGYGKQYIDFNSGDVPKPLEVVVAINSKDGALQTEGRLTIEPQPPTVNFYEIDPLYGVFFNREVGGRVDMKNSETTILAVPYGFNKNNVLDYVWSINNLEQPDLSKNQSITLRTKGETDGNSSIDLDLRNSSSILQGARASFAAFFKKKVTEGDNQTTF